MNIVSIFLILAFVLQTFAYFPLIRSINAIKNMDNIPYITLWSILGSNLLFVIISIWNGFYYHSLLFLTNAIIMGWFVFAKKYIYIDPPTSEN
jgi:uncharacterized protein with PQ loop repeat